MMSTVIKGNTTEAAVLKAFVARGFGVLIPFGGGQPFDLVVPLGPTDFLRVQCKTARLLGGCVVFNGRSTDHGRGRLSYDGLADVIAAYYPNNDTVYVVPVSSRFSPRLRLEPPRNNQKQGVHMAVDYELGSWSHESLVGIACAGRSGGERGHDFA